MRENHLSRGNKSVIEKRSKRKIEYTASFSSSLPPLSSSFLFYTEDPNLDSNNDEYAKEKRVRTEEDDDHDDDHDHDFSYDNDNYELYLTDEGGVDDTTTTKEGIYTLTNSSSNNNFSYFNNEFTSEVEHSNRLERLLKDALYPCKSDHLNNMIVSARDSDYPSSQYYTNNDKIDPLNQPISQVLSANELLMKCMQEKHESDAFLNYISQMR
jgi:hypothetical protein